MRLGKGLGGHISVASLHREAVLTQPAAGQSSPLAETSEEGESISGFLISLGEVGGSGEVKVRGE